VFLPTNLILVELSDIIYVNKQGLINFFGFYDFALKMPMHPLSNNFIFESE
jgi:hypothetical protein